MYTLKKGDCLDLMDALPDGSVDMVLCDLPYGTTACKWDSVIDLQKLWTQYERVIKDNGAVVLFGAQPFTSALVLSNVKLFRYDLVWDKVNRYTGYANANKMPLRRHEELLVFYKHLPTFNKQYREGKPYKSRTSTKAGSHMGATGFAPAQEITNDGRHNPCSIIEVKGDNKLEHGLHPTQKPTALCEYLVRTYTNEGDLVLDNTMGSGTTGVACANTGRRFYGIELNDYFEAAEKRIQDAYWNKQLVLPNAADAFDSQW